MAPRAAIHYEHSDILWKAGCLAWSLRPPFIANIIIFCAKFGAPHGSLPQFLANVTIFNVKLGAGMAPWAAVPCEYNDIICKVGCLAWRLRSPFIANIAIFHVKLSARHDSSGRHSLRTCKTGCPAWLLGPPFLANVAMPPIVYKVGCLAWLLGSPYLANI